MHTLTRLYLKLQANLEFVDPFDKNDTFSLREL